MEIPPLILKEIGERAHSAESRYSPHATRNAEFLRKYHHKEEYPVIRPPFYRDADRILHSKAFSRYIDKTQVFYLVENDHVTHRVLHVQLVSKVARTIGRALGLNEDLIEAIALGHDIGHVPYGHLGESILNRLCRKQGIGSFSHNIQSVRFLDTIEDCDLTLQVLDGILCHNGEKYDTCLHRNGERSWESFADKYGRIQHGEDCHPLTLEGCVVRCADSISYLGRDLQDALEVRLIDEGDLACFPPNCKDSFGITELSTEAFQDINRTVLDVLIKDIITTSYNRDCIRFSDHISACVQDFKHFNYAHIYENPRLEKEQKKIENMFCHLFTLFLEDVQEGNRHSAVYTDFITTPWISPRYRKNAQPPELVRDFLAGMTDRYFERIFRTSILPRKVKQAYEKI